MWVALKPNILTIEGALALSNPRALVQWAPWSSESHRGNELEELGLDPQPQLSV